MTSDEKGLFIAWFICGLVSCLVIRISIDSPVTLLGYLAIIILGPVSGMVSLAILAKIVFGFLATISI